jgi:hypothetical protein
MNEVKVRNRDKIAHCWQDKRIRRFLRQHYDQSNKAGTALSVYDGLTEVASNEANDEFIATYANIADKSGVSKRTVMRFTDDFEYLRIIKVERRKDGKKNLPSKFVLLAFDTNSPETTSESSEATYERKRLEKKIEKRIETLLACFNSFWEIYPNKIDKDIAYQLFRELNPSSKIFQDMINELRKASNHEWSKGKSFDIPTPARWLMERSWE